MKIRNMRKMRKLVKICTMKKTKGRSKTKIKEKELNNIQVV